MQSDPTPAEARGWPAILRDYAYPHDADDAATAALKKAARVITQMHEEKAWCSGDVQETLDMIRRVLATPSTDARSRGQAEERESICDADVEQIARAMYEEWPHMVSSQALVAATGKPLGHVLTWNEALAAGWDPCGIRRHARGVVKRFAIRSGETPVGEGRGIPEGYALVPIEPTPAMVKAGSAGSEYQSYMGHACSSSVRGTYAAMLAVLPDVKCRGWRPEVVAFADLMERQLRANDHKPGWKRDDPLDLLDRVVDETEELVRAVRRHIAIGNDLEPSRGSDPCWRTGVAHLIGPEAADIANFAMMVADVCGALPDAPLPAPPSIRAGEGPIP